MFNEEVMVSHAFQELVALAHIPSIQKNYVSYFHFYDYFLYCILIHSIFHGLYFLQQY